MGWGQFDCCSQLPFRMRVARRHSREMTFQLLSQIVSFIRLVDVPVTAP
jgi:hypothetical protein